LPVRGAGRSRVANLAARDVRRQRIVDAVTARTETEESKRFSPYVALVVARQSVSLPPAPPMILGEPT
jgi:hypothetical protein